MSDCLVPSYHSPASSMQTLAPASESTCAATPPPAPEPTTITSYVLGVAFACAIPTILRLWRSSAPAQFQHPGGLRQQLLGQIGQLDGYGAGAGLEAQWGRNPEQGHGLQFCAFVLFHGEVPPRPARQDGV